ncbi:MULTISPECIES: cupin domain-containing protein [unclassified Streptomyces]|uniref:cupin domain-containing protein n=1 Tax=unclassified Streptomyces TaxID=2593676 RepID=UPI0022513BE7|nr:MULTISPECIES: cupin domain-containing protein [unclassified Streptomyces]MCX4526925.1 cupin domain-containing protein [Streptomyces sp. NBC_01551]MCX4542515.1 cupin domain-containing protein [Streptomyces sp. NBC_01565]
MTTAHEDRSRLWGKGSVVTTELTAEQTGGVLGVTRFQALKGERGPRHTHSLEDEVFLVNSGELVMTLGDQTFEVSGSGALFLPRGIPHSYLVESATADFRVITTPGGFERFFSLAGYPVSLGENAPVGDKWSVDRTQDFAERLGLGLTWSG